MKAQEIQGEKGPARRSRDQSASFRLRRFLCGAARTFPQTDSLVLHFPLDLQSRSGSAAPGRRRRALRPAHRVSPGSCAESNATGSGLSSSGARADGRAPNTDGSYDTTVRQEGHAWAGQGQEGRQRRKVSRHVMRVLVCSPPSQLARSPWVLAVACKIDCITARGVYECGSVMRAAAERVPLYGCKVQRDQLRMRGPAK